MSELDNEIFVCMWCQKKCDATQGSWPQKAITDREEYVMDADLNNRSREEFICYDCIDS